MCIIASLALQNLDCILMGKKKKSSEGMGGNKKGNLKIRNNSNMLLSKNLSRLGSLLYPLLGI